MEVKQWFDEYGASVQVGDSIHFQTLYGSRIAKVISISSSSDPILPGGFAIDQPVIFGIEPLQVGPVDAFKPITKIETNSMWNPRKEIGRKRDSWEALFYFCCDPKKFKQSIDFPPSEDAKNLAKEAFTR